MYSYVVFLPSDVVCDGVTAVCLTESQASPDTLKALAKELNELKTRFLLDLKKDVLHRVSVFPEEELPDVAAEFERRTRDCVQTRVKHH